MTSSPFKFLDSYTLSDRDIFFGREAEIEEVYSRLFYSKLLLVYGPSGSGKTSLLQCGVANRFGETNWKPIFIRRKQNINNTIHSELEKQSITKLKSEKTVSEKLYSLYLDYLTPVYLIFDQFEELFIFGSVEEKQEFVNTLKEILSHEEINTQIILSIREEYLANLSEFEDELPQLFENRIRIEKMKKAQALEAIEGPCKVAGVKLEESVSEKVLERLSTKSGYIELTWLQVLMDNLYKKANERNPNELKIQNSDVEQLGKMGDVLGNFLEDQLKAMPEGEKGEALLKAMITSDGTKKQLTPEEIETALQSLGHQLTKEEIQQLLQHLVNVRILSDKDESGRYELKHDSLAAKIYEKLTLAEKELMEVRQFVEYAYQNYQSRGKYLSEDDLKYIAPYEGKLVFKKELDRFVEVSRKELLKVKRRKQRFFLSGSIGLILILLGFTYWALREKNKTSTEKQRAKALYFNILANETKTKNPTKALRILEEAYYQDSSNRDIKENLLRTYNEFSNYKIIGKIRPKKLIRVLYISYSISASRLVTVEVDRTKTNTVNDIYLWDFNGNLIRNFIEEDERILLDFLQIAPDGNFVFSGDFSGNGYLWEINSDAPCKFIGHSQSLTSVAFSSDNKYILTGSNDQTARLWDFQGNLIQTYSGHTDKVMDAKLSEDNKYVLTGSGDGTARLWSIEGELIKEFNNHGGALKSVDISPDNHLILAVSLGNSAQLLDFEGNIMQEFITDNLSITATCFSHNGRSILFGYGDGSIRLLDVNGNIQQEFLGHEESIQLLRFSEDDNNIFSASNDLSIRKWRIEGQIEQTFKLDETALSLSFSNNGEMLLACLKDGSVKIYNSNGDILVPVISNLNTWKLVSFSPDDKMIIINDFRNPTSIWRINGEHLISFEDERMKNIGTKILAISPDGQNVFVNLFTRSAMFNINGDELFQIVKKSIADATFSPNGKYFAIGLNDGWIYLYDITGKLIRTFEGHEDAVLEIKISPSGDKILSGSVDKTARLWDFNGDLLQVFTGHSKPVSIVECSPDGNKVLTSSKDDVLRIWDINDGLIQIFREPNIRVLSAIFTPDSKSILIGCANGLVHKLYLKENYYSLNRENYEELNTTDKLRWQIMEFENLSNINDPSILYDAASYYLENKFSTANISESKDNLDKGLVLIKKAWKYSKDILIFNAFMNALVDLNNNDPSSRITTEIDKIFDQILQIDSVEYLFEVADLYYSLSLKASTEKFNFHEKTIKVYSKIICYDEIDSIRLNKLALKFSGYSYNLLERKLFTEALDFSLLAESADSNAKVLYSNLALSYLLNSKWSKAREIYTTWKDSMYLNFGYQKFQVGFLEDLNAMEKIGITHPDFEKVRNLLNENPDD